MTNVKGFTLLELLCTLAVATILITMALPNFSDYLNQVKGREIRAKLHQILQFARTSAVTHSSYVTVCQISQHNPKECEKTKSWDGPTMVFVDHNRDEKLQDQEEGGAEKLLRRFDPPSIHGQLWATRPYFSFSAPGTSNQSASLIYCPNSSLVPPTRVVVMYSGRIRYANSNEIKC